MPKKFLFIFSLVLMLLVDARADQQVATGLINSDQTYIVNDQGESVQEYGVGQPVYIVTGSKNSGNKKYKDFYRITFDPTNLDGDGWVLKDKVRLMTAYHSIDGKEPKEYENRPEIISPTKGKGKSSAIASSDGFGEASSFLEELIKKDEKKAELTSITQNLKATETVVKNDEKNPFENDLEFLFQEEGEFKKTFKETKANLKESMKKKIGVSQFSAAKDLYALKVLEQFSSNLKKDGEMTTVSQVDFLPNIEDASKVTIANDLDGVFFGQISPKIGESRLLKIKYYDKILKQFTFEKVAKLPLTDPTKTVETLANECSKFLSK